MIENALGGNKCRAIVNTEKCGSVGRQTNEICVSTASPAEASKVGHAPSLDGSAVFKYSRLLVASVRGNRAQDHGCAENYVCQVRTFTGSTRKGRNSAQDVWELYP